MLRRLRNILSSRISLYYDPDANRPNTRGFVEGERGGGGGRGGVRWVYDCASPPVCKRGGGWG